MREWINEYLRGPTQYPRDNRHAASVWRYRVWWTPRSDPVHFTPELLVGRNGWAIQTDPRRVQQINSENRWAWLVVVRNVFLSPATPTDLHRTQFLISFVFQPQHILAPVTDYKWPHCLQKAGVSVEGRWNRASPPPTPEAWFPARWRLLGFQPPRESVKTTRGDV